MTVAHGTLKDVVVIGGGGGFTGLNYAAQLLEPVVTVLVGTSTVIFIIVKIVLAIREEQRKGREGA